MNISPSVIICDLGNVLAFFNREITYKKMSAHLPHDAEEIGQRLEDSGLREKFEIGQIDETSFFLQAINLFDPPHEMGYEMFCRFYGDIFTTNRGLLKFLNRFKNNTTFVLISNTSSLHFDSIKKNNPEVLDLFGGRHVLSYEEGLSKPDERMFAKALEVAGDGITFKDCLFIDDTKEYVDAASALGMMAYHYTGLLDFATFIKKIFRAGTSTVH